MHCDRRALGILRFDVTIHHALRRALRRASMKKFEVFLNCMCTGERAFVDKRVLRMLSQVLLWPM